MPKKSTLDRQGRLYLVVEPPLSGNLVVIGLDLQNKKMLSRISFRKRGEFGRPHLNGETNSPCSMDWYHLRNLMMVQVVFVCCVICISGQASANEPTENFKNSDLYDISQLLWSGPYLIVQSATGFEPG